jgi:hypothetical protein
VNFSVPPRDALSACVGHGNQLDAGDLDGGFCVAHALAACADEGDLDMVVGCDGAWYQIRGERVQSGAEQRACGCC